jgi:hypothetical protein
MVFTVKLNQQKSETRGKTQGNGCFFLADKL